MFAFCRVRPCRHTELTRRNSISPKVTIADLIPIATDSNESFGFGIEMDDLAYAADIEQDDIRIIGIMLFSLHPLVYRAHRGEDARMPLLVQSKTVWNALYGKDIPPPENSMYIEVHKPLAHPQCITNKFMKREGTEYIEEQCEIALEALRHVRLMNPKLEGLDKSEVFFRMLGYTNVETFQEDKDAMRKLMEESSKRGGEHSAQITELTKGIRKTETAMKFDPVLAKLKSLHDDNGSELGELTREIIGRYVRRKLKLDKALRGLAHRIVSVNKNHQTKSEIQEHIRRGRDGDESLNDICSSAKEKFPDSHHVYIDSQLTMIEIREFIRSQVAGGDLLETVRTSAKENFPESYHGYVDMELEKNSVLFPFIEEVNRHRDSIGIDPVRMGFNIISKEGTENYHTLNTRITSLLDSDLVEEWIRDSLREIWHEYCAKLGQERAKEEAKKGRHYHRDVQIKRDPGPRSAADTDDW